MPTPVASAEQQAEAAVVREATRLGHLTFTELRAALLLRERLHARGQRVGLLPLLAEGPLPGSSLPALRVVYERAFAEARRQGARPSVTPVEETPRESDAEDVFVSDEIVRIPAEVRVETVELSKQPQSRDPAVVREFLMASAETSDAPGSTVFTPNQARPETVAAPDPATRPDRAPRHIGRYQIEGEIGRGGMGVVYRARDSKLGREVAVKVLQLGTGPDPLKRFQREAQATATLRHPNIVPVFDYGASDGLPYLVLELIDGEPLDARLDRLGKLDPSEAAAICQGVAEGLEHAHQSGVVHRDVKPSNILIERGGKPLLTDFGMAKTIDVQEAITLSGQILGTPDYMPPEQARGEFDKVDARSDVYALGASLYQLLTGQRPFQTPALALTLAAICEAPPKPPRSVRAEVSEDLNTIVLKCLEKDRADRYDSAGALAADLGRFLEGDPILARPPSPGRLLKRWLGRNRARAVSWCLAVLVSLVAIAGSRNAIHDSASDLHRAESEPYPADARGYVERGRYFALRHCDWQRAEADLSEALALDPRSEQASLWRGYTRMNRGNYGPALGDLARALELEPTLVDAYVYRAAIYMRRRDPRDIDLARKNIFSALALDPENSLAYELRGSIAVLERRFQDAHKDFSHALQLNPDQASSYLNRRRVREAMGDFPAALADAERYLALRPHDPIAYRGRAVCLKNLGRFDEAERDYDRAIQMDPSESNYRARSIARLTRRDTQGALADINQAIQIAPWSVESLLHRSAIWTRLGELAKALADAERAVEVSGGSPRAVACRGTARIPVGQLDGAIADLTVAIQAGIPFSFFNRGIARFEKRDYAGALADYTNAIEESPKYARAYSNRALVHEARRDFLAAHEDCSRALELEENALQGLWIRGRVGVQLQRYAAAQRDLELAIQRFPPNAEGKKQCEALVALCKRRLAAAPRRTKAQREARTWHQRGRERHRARDLEGAVAAFDHALKLDPGFTGALIDRGSSHYQLQNYPAALEDYSRALEIDPQDTLARCNRGIVYTKLGQYPKAIIDLERTLKELPKESPLREGAQQALTFARRRLR